MTDTTEETAVIPAEYINLTQADATAVLTYFQNLYPSTSAEDAATVLVELAEAVNLLSDTPQAEIGWRGVRLPKPFTGWMFVREWLTADNVLTYFEAELPQKMPNLSTAKEFWRRVNAGFVTFGQVKLGSELVEIDKKMALSSDFPSLLGAFVYRETTEVFSDATNLKK